MQDGPYSNMTWHNPPVDWVADGPKLTVTTGDRTDFWNHTFYGFLRSDGHFLYREVAGDFTCEVTLIAGFEVLYDQLGLMVRHDDNNWMKTGLEYSDGCAQLSAVVTRGWSDWSVTPIPKPEVQTGVRLRLTRHDSAFRVQKQMPDGAWQLVRLAYLDVPALCQVGLMCCAPERAGYRAVFRDFAILPAIPRELHA